MGDDLKSTIAVVILAIAILGVVFGQMTKQKIFVAWTNQRQLQDGTVAKYSKPAKLGKTSHREDSKNSTKEVISQQPQDAQIPESYRDCIPTEYDKNQKVKWELIPIRENQIVKRCPISWKEESKVIRYYKLYGGYYQVNKYSDDDRQVTYYQNGKIQESQSFCSDGRMRSLGEYKNGYRHGWSRSYDCENGRLNYEGYYQMDVLHGPSRNFYSNGQLKEETFYQAGKKTGSRRRYYGNGHLKIEQSYRQDRLVGDYRFFDQNGQLIKSGNYDDRKDEEFEVKYCRAPGEYWDNSNSCVIVSCTCRHCFSGADAVRSDYADRWYEDQHCQKIPYGGGCVPDEGCREAKFACVGGRCVVKAGEWITKEILRQRAINFILD